jgi:hypothetical protein
VAEAVVRVRAVRSPAADEVVEVADRADVVELAVLAQRDPAES